MNKWEILSSEQGLNIIQYFRLGLQIEKQR